jgi:hypothetical protein
LRGVVGGSNEDVESYFLTTVLLLSQFVVVDVDDSGGGERLQVELGMASDSQQGHAIRDA